MTRDLGLVSTGSGGGMAPSGGARPSFAGEFLSALGRGAFRGVAELPVMAASGIGGAAGMDSQEGDWLDRSERRLAAAEESMGIDAGDWGEFSAEEQALLRGIQYTTELLIQLPLGAAAIGKTVGKAAAKRGVRKGGEKAAKEIVKIGQKDSAALASTVASKYKALRAAPDGKAAREIANDLQVDLARVHGGAAENAARQLGARAETLARRTESGMLRQAGRDAAAPFFRVGADGKVGKFSPAKTLRAKLWQIE